jgi:hypothetical protein
VSFSAKRNSNDGRKFINLKKIDYLRESQEEKELKKKKNTHSILNRNIGDFLNKEKIE